MIILDLDGVIVDFVRGAFKLHKKEIPMKDVTWAFWEHLCPTYADFWKDMGREFWANLNWTPEGPELVAGLEKAYGTEIIVCTSPCLTEGCVEGKLDWIKKYMPKYNPRRFFVGAPKEACAGNGNILLDDNDANIDQFRKYKGKAITIPRPWNRRANESLAHGGFDVAKILKELHGA